VSAIDVVHKDFFDDWVKRHVEVYAQKFATVALRHQTEIATGSGYVTGMGVNSWTGEKRPDGVMPLDASSCSKAAAGLSLKASNSGFGPRVQRTFDIKYFVPLEQFFAIVEIPDAQKYRHLESDQPAVDLKGDTNLRILFGSCNCFDAGHFDFEFAHRIHPRRPLTI
jgi:hypothetical protein